MPSLFIDTWGWIVLADKKDPAFEKVSAFYHSEKQQNSLLITTDYILDELITFLYAKVPVHLAHSYIQSILDSIAKGFIRMERIGTDRFEKTWELRKQYKDHPRISFTDLSSFVVMTELKITRALTHDQHFEHVNMGFEKVP